MGEGEQRGHVSRQHPPSMAAVALLALATTAWLPQFQLPQLGVQKPAAAVELRDALVAGQSDMSTLAPLADACADARVRFDAKLLADGALWRATSIVRGEVPRWERNARLLPFLANRAGQAYSLGGGGGGGGSVTNYGEVLGRGLYFKACGTFAPAPKQTSSDRCPQDFTVAITEGGFVLGGAPFLSSAISGPGFLRILYVDEDIRIFESPKDSPDRWEEAGLVVVQVRDDLFDDPVVGDL